MSDVKRPLCGSCRHFYSHGSSGRGECRFDPPVASRDRVGGSVGTWPPVEGRNWCSKHSDNVSDVGYGLHEVVAALRAAAESA